ncbi:unnamed protein product [Arabis nemorensis]|uniref:Uncharacterized protein n=1 Tax=Arabis nemorensis TaxID=586526 RepID=A0A565BW31_9BRAS|nr:unnamed protein product [Arabis nemorensis]
MQRSVEEENFDNTSLDILMKEQLAIRIVLVRKAPPLQGKGLTDATQKHDCEIMSHEVQNTQEAEYNKVGKGGFGSHIEVVGTEPTLGTDPVGTEQVNETQSPGNDYERNDHLRKSIILAGDTIQTQVHESIQNDEAALLLRNPLDDRRDAQETEGVGTIRTSHLLASEFARSWAYSTAPSVHRESETEKIREDEESHTQRIKEVTIAHVSATQDTDIEEYENIGCVDSTLNYEGNTDIEEDQCVDVGCCGKEQFQLSLNENEIYDSMSNINAEISKIVF